MKLKLASTFCALLALIAPLGAAVDTGDKAPAFTLTTVEGKSVSLADFKGQYVVLEWTNPHCPFVKKFYDVGAMQEHQNKAKGMDVAWLVINSTSPEHGDFKSAEAMKSWGKDKNVKAHMLLDKDGKVGKAYAAATTPHMFIIDPEGTVIYQGAIDSIRSADSDDIAKADNYVMAALTAAKDGKPVEKDRTRPYGCSVKYN